MKAQNVFFSDGMIGSIFIAALHTIDNIMLNLSALGNKLNELLPFMPNSPADCPTKYALFCDGIFKSHKCLFNKPMTYSNAHTSALRFCAGAAATTEIPGVGSSTSRMMLSP